MLLIEFIWCGSEFLKPGHIWKNDRLPKLVLADGMVRLVNLKNIVVYLEYTHILFVWSRGVMLLRHLKNLKFSRAANEAGVESAWYGHDFVFRW